MTEAIKQLQADLGLTADGKRGPVTTSAILMAADEGRLRAIPRVPAPVTTPGTVVYPRQADMVAFYGPAGGPDCTAGSVDLPFAFPLAWDRSQRVMRFSCHRKLERPFETIFAESAKNYGEERFRALGLDLFGGCYNYRLMRGGSSLSIHSWGAAYDVDPEHNPLGAKRAGATLDGLEYEPFWRIVEAQGALSLGRQRDFDWQHFQFARL